MIHVIKEAARKVFEEKGYKDAKIAEIAREADVAPATIYLYFKSKRELFDSLNRPDLMELTPSLEKRKRLIVETALQVFAEQGYAAATMEMIAARCGFTKALLYNYYQSKESLFKEIFKSAGITHQVEESLKGMEHTDLYGLLKEMGLIFLAMLESQPRRNLLRVVIAESVRFPEIGRSFAENAATPLQKYLSAYLEEQAKAGRFPKIDPVFFAKAYFGILMSFVVTDLLIIGQKELDKPLLVDKVLTIFEQRLL